ncbi:MAG: gamma-glutamyltransferase [Candidatus Saccharimonadaceae bacterium]
MKNYLIRLSRFVKIALPVFFLIMSMYSVAQDRVTGLPFATRSEVIAQKGMVASSQPLATQIGLDILKKGGSAVDAAIAVNAALGLMEPTGSGVGGDLFAIVYEAKTGKLYGLNASGRSPKALTLDYFKEKGYKTIPSLGPLPVNVPGCVDGWIELNKRFGKLSMEQLLAPTICYAEDGFPVSELVAYYMGRSVANMGDMFPNVLETYTVDGKNAPQKGDIFKNPMLANTYRKIAKGGHDAFYNGEMAHTIADFIKSQGGFLNYNDLASHHSEWVEPVSTNYRGFDVWELPPNGQGIAALEMLNILEGYDFSQISYGSSRHIHLFIEAKQLAFEDRAKYYADMKFSKVPVQQLISKKYADERRKLINENKAGVYKAGEPMDGGTIYLTTADSEGNMVSLIQSNYRGMGSGMVPPGLGFMLQDRGELFSLDANHANVFAPEKRPFHTIIPSFITKDGVPFVSFGVMGGDFQPMGHVQIVMNLIDFGMNLQEAGDAPRINHSGGSNAIGTGSPERGEILLESGFNYQVIRDLMQMGHKVGFVLGDYGGYQAIMYEAKRKIFFGASESRKDGQSAGY